MFVKVFFEDNIQRKSDLEGSIDLHPSKLLVNPDCPIGIIYDYIRKSFTIRNDLELDLCDESGNLVFIYDKDPCSNGTSYLTPKGNYFVVTFEKDEDGKLINPYFSIPENFRKTPAQLNELMSKIKKQMSPGFLNRGSKSSKNRSISSALMHHNK